MVRIAMFLGMCIHFIDPMRKHTVNYFTDFEFGLVEFILLGLLIGILLFPIT